MPASQSRSVAAPVSAEGFEDQRQFLEALLAEIQQAISQRRATEVARNILERLAQSAGGMFAREESQMMAVGYAGIDSHREQHRELAHQILSFAQRAPESNAAIGFELKVFLKAWLAQHVNEADRRFQAYLTTLDENKRSSEPGSPWWKVW